MRNYNPLLGRYPGADGMKTGFICASGFNLVATATRDNKQLIAVVLGAPSGAARAVKAAEMLESGFAQNPLSWLMPSLGTVDELTPIDAAPPNLKDECADRTASGTSDGRRRRRRRRDDARQSRVGDTNPQFSVLLSALRAPTPRTPICCPISARSTPIVVYTGPTRTPEQIAALAALPEAAEPAKKKRKHKPLAGAKTAGSRKPRQAGKPAGQRGEAATAQTACRAKPAHARAVGTAKRARRRHARRHMKLAHPRPKPARPST